MKNLLNILLYSLIITCSNCSLLINNFNRRSILEYITTTTLSSNNIFTSNNNESLFNPLSIKKPIYTEKDDMYSHWSFYGIFPPPIKSTITYEELVNEINNNNIYSVQIAVQHDCVIATTNEGYRLSCLMPDEKFNDLYTDSMDVNGELKIRFLPIDETKSKIRKTAQISFFSISMYYLLSELNIIDVDTTPYSSIKERDDARNSGNPPKKIIGSIISAIDFIKKKNNTNNTTSNISNI